MESRAKLFGHPIHPMLIPFPLGLLATSVVFDVVHLLTDKGKWAEVAYWMIAAGIVGGLAAAPFGLIDWLALPRGTRARSIGLWHGVGNVAVLVLFAASWLLRRDDPRDPGTLPFVLSVVGVAISAVTGWLGGELVDRLGVGVDRGGAPGRAELALGPPGESGGARRQDRGLMTARTTVGAAPTA